MENPLTQKMEDCLKAQKEKSCKSFDLQDFFHLISYVLCMRVTSYRLRVAS